MEGDPARAGEVHLPRLRDDQPGSGALPRHPARLSGPGLLAMILFEKFGQHQPLNRQAERYARGGVPLSLSTLADQVGAGAAAPMMTTGSWRSPMKASRRSNSSSKNIIASPHRKLDPSTPVLRFSWPPDTHVCGLHRMRTSGIDPLHSNNTPSGPVNNAHAVPQTTLARTSLRAQTRYRATLQQGGLRRTRRRRTVVPRTRRHRQASRLSCMPHQMFPSN